MDKKMVKEEEFALVEKRLEAWSEKINVACITGENLSKDQMLEHVKARDSTGQKLTEIQIHYLRKLKERKR